MSMRFILAPAGGGKTYTCIKEIAALCGEEPLGQPIYFILPEQATFIHERLLCQASLSGGFCRAHVCSFNRLSAIRHANVSMERWPVARCNSSSA